MIFIFPWSLIWFKMELFALIVSIVLSTLFLVTTSTKASFLDQMSEQGKIKIVGAYYDLHTGAVTFL